MIATPSYAWKPWIIYTRVALAGPGDSIAAQGASGVAYCKRHGYSWAVVTDRGYSGLDMERPGMKKVLALIQAESITGVVVSHLDRFARALDLLDEFVALCEHHHVALVETGKARPKFSWVIDRRFQ